MSNLISRSALIKKIRDYADEVGCVRGEYELANGILKAISVVEDAQTIEAKPVVHGKWKRIGSGSLYDTYECTNCHRQPKWDCLGDNHWRIAFTDICPYCGAIMNGADMRGGKNET